MGVGSSGGLLFVYMLQQSASLLTSNIQVDSELPLACPRLLRDESPFLLILLTAVLGTHARSICSPSSTQKVLQTIVKFGQFFTLEEGGCSCRHPWHCGDFFPQKKSFDGFARGRNNSRGNRKVMMSLTRWPAAAGSKK